MIVPAATGALPRTEWRTQLMALGLAAAALLLLFRADALHLLSIWWTSSTFSHCLIIVPIIGWLVAIRREALLNEAPMPCYPALLWTAAGAFIWLLGEAASVSLLRHAGLIVMLQSLVPVVLGLRALRILSFPVFYALFLIPFGEELVPPMQLLTADMAMVMLRLTGIPAHIEGIFITTPAGLFAVAEACSGVKFLVAMAALAVLAAHLCFSSWRRRAVFLLVALIVPVLANGVRAFSTIWIAERFGLEHAAGADHLIYGWLFFAIVIALVGGLSWRWFDRDPLASGEAARSPDAASSAVQPAPWMFAAAAAGAIAAAPQLYQLALRSSTAPLSITAYPVINGWPARLGADAQWRPRFDGADRRQDYVLRSADGKGVVHITVAGYLRQREGAELVGFAQGAVDPASDWRWERDLGAIDNVTVQRIARDGGGTRDVLTLYRVGEDVTASAAEVKWLTLTAHLFGRDARAYAVVVAAGPLGYSDGAAQLRRLISDAGGAAALVRSLTPAR